jgi:hypothetical protein
VDVLYLRRLLACRHWWPTSRRRRPILFSCLFLFLFLVPRIGFLNRLRKRLGKVRSGHVTARTLTSSLLRPRRSRGKGHSIFFLSRGRRGLRARGEASDPTRWRRRQRQTTCARIPVQIQPRQFVWPAHRHRLVRWCFALRDRSTNGIRFVF